MTRTKSQIVASNWIDFHDNGYQKWHLLVCFSERERYPISQPYTDWMLTKPWRQEAWILLSRKQHLTHSTLMLCYVLGAQTMSTCEPLLWFLTFFRPKEAQLRHTSKYKQGFDQSLKNKTFCVAKVCLFLLSHLLILWPLRATLQTLWNHRFRAWSSSFSCAKELKCIGWIIANL